MPNQGFYFLMSGYEIPLRIAAEAATYLSGMAGLAGLAKSLTRKAVPNNVATKTSYRKTVMPNSRTSSRVSRRPVQRRGRKRVLKKRVAKKRKSKTYSKDRSIAKRVRTLERKTSDITSTLKYRYNDTTSLICPANQAVYDVQVVNDATWIETVLAQLRYYDPAAPGTIVTAAGGTGTYTRSFRVKSSTVWNIRNNYQIPVKCTLYVYRVFNDNNADPVSIMDTVLADMSNVTKTNPMITPRDCGDFDHTWKYVKSVSSVLLPGANKRFSASCPEIRYDPSVYDNVVFVNQTVFKTIAVVIRLEGVVSHDVTTTTNIGISNGAVDIVRDRYAICRYNSGGPSLTYTYVNSNYDAQAVGPIVSQLVVDNQSFSAV